MEENNNEIGSNVTEKFKNFFWGIVLTIVMFVGVGLAFSTPIGVLGVIRYIMEDILLILLIGIICLMSCVYRYKISNKFKIKDMFTNIIAILFAVGFIYIGGKNATNLGKDLILGSLKVETFYDFSVSIEGRRSASRYTLNAKRNADEVLEFKINTDLYMKAGRCEYVTILYYENTKIVMDIEYAGAK